MSVRPSPRPCAAGDTPTAYTSPSDGAPASAGRRGLAAGRRLVGRKIGLTSKVMQVATGITEPDYGEIHQMVREAIDPSLKPTTTPAETPSSSTSSSSTTTPTDEPTEPTDELTDITESC